MNSLDGAHLSLMMTWVRTNQWRGAASAKLRVKQLAAGADAAKAMKTYGLRVPKGGASDTLGGLGRDKKSRTTLKNDRNRRGGGDGLSRLSAGAPKPPKCATSVFAVAMLDGGKVGGRVFVDESTGLAWRAEFYHQRGVETWMYEGWKRMTLDDGSEITVPNLAHRAHAEGQVTVFRAANTKTVTLTDEMCAMPRRDEVPSSIMWGDATESEVSLVTCRGEGGHVLVQGTTRSDDGAVSANDWYVLDTASTGMAISPHTAQATKMSIFGSMSIIGVAAPLQGSLRRGYQLSLGAMTVYKPLFMEQNLDGAVRTPNSEPLGGVLGNPIFAHSIVSIHAPLRIPGSRSAPDISVRVIQPTAYSPSPEVERAWQPVFFIDGVPYVELAYTIANDGFKGVTEMTMERVGLFKLALGTGGVGAVLSSKIAEDADVANRTRALQPSGIMSGPGENASRLQRVGDEIVTGRVETIRFKSFEIKNIRAVMHLDGDTPDLDISPHADGAVCADAFRGCELVCDLNTLAPRIAVVPP